MWVHVCLFFYPSILVKFYFQWHQQSLEFNLAEAVDTLIEKVTFVKHIVREGVLEKNTILMTPS